MAGIGRSALRLWLATIGAAWLAAIPASALASSLGSCCKNEAEVKAERRFVHHVFFWLNNPGNAEDRQKLIEGLHELSRVGTIRRYHIGIPAGTPRDVVDNSYAISWMVMFDSKEDQDAYQIDPIHLQFVDDYGSVWNRVIVYDSVVAEGDR